jgi:hypothetical protein
VTVDEEFESMVSGLELHDQHTQVCDQDGNFVLQITGHSGSVEVTLITALEQLLCLYLLLYRSVLISGNEDLVSFLHPDIHPDSGEHDSPAPEVDARAAGVMLAIQLLSSAKPSLSVDEAETVMRSLAGLAASVHAKPELFGEALGEHNLEGTMSELVNLLQVVTSLLLEAIESAEI